MGVPYRFGHLPPARTPAPLLGQVAGQANHRRLARGVGRLGEPYGRHRENATDVDDARARRHDLRTRLGHPVCTHEVRLDDASKFPGCLPTSRY